MSATLARETRAADLTAPLLLGSYAARSCPVKTQNTFNPTVRLTTAEGTGADAPDDALAELFDGGERFRAVILERLITSCLGRVVDLRLLSAEPPVVQVEACLRALASGAEVVVGGLLPADREGHRAGGPDVLVRGADRADGRPGYHPVEVKWHKIIDRSRRGSARDAAPADGLRYSVLAAPRPDEARRLEGSVLRLASREADFLQLAHYFRMLQAAGWAAEEPLAAVIGTDDQLGEPVLGWADLAADRVRTFSRSTPDGWRLRSLLERYDHEHAFRVDIAAVARQQTGRPEVDPALLVAPIVTAECARCVWWEHCRPQLDPDDVSLRIEKTPLDMREISTLRQHGIATITDLAGADLEALLADYLPEVTHRTGAESRLRLAARRARMMLDDRPFDRETSGPIEVPGAAVEIDFDIESSTDGRVYLWGFLVHRTGEPGPGHYKEFSTFADLDDAAETALAVDAFRWLRAEVEAAPSALVYHYSGYETAKILALAEREGDPLLDWAANYAVEQFVDLLEVVKTHFFGVRGLGLKMIAQQAGFGWRDDDPGGLNSQRWFAEAVHGESAETRERARARVLEYNEDDVLATSRLRAWLRAQ